MLGGDQAQVCARGIACEAVPIADFHREAKGGQQRSIDSQHSAGCISVLGSVAGLAMMGRVKRRKLLLTWFILTTTMHLLMRVLRAWVLSLCGRYAGLPQLKESRVVVDNPLQKHLAVYFSSVCQGELAE